MSFECLKRKIPKKCVVRDYNDPSNSSKADVLYYNLPRKQKKRDRFASNNRRMTKFGGLGSKLNDPQSQRVFRESIYNPNSLFEKEEDENEPDNATSATFFCHNRQLIFIKDSCYIFKKNSRIRYYCIYITEAPLFKFFVLVIIITQAVLFGFYDYIDTKSTSQMNKLVDTIEPIFLVLYGLECAMKIIARGFYSEPNCYLRKLIHFVDLFVVVAGWFSYKSFFKHFGILRFFRVLFVLSKLPHLKSLKMLGTILKNSMGHMLTILFFLWIFLTLFAIAGLNIYKGDLNYRCRLTPEPLQGYWPVNETETRICGGAFQCYTNETCGSNFDYIKTPQSYITGDPYNDTQISQMNFAVTNFDNLLYALVPTCQIYMVEGFHEIMYLLYDATNRVIPTIFSLILIVICGFFMSNMVVAAMVDNFSKECEKNRTVSILKDTTRDLGAVMTQKEASSSFIGSVSKKIKVFFKKPTFTKSDFKESSQYYAFFIVRNPFFHITMYVLVVVNMLILALDQYPSPPEEELAVFGYINLAFTVIFVLECILKIKGYGVEKYKKDKFNIIELIVAFCTTIEIIAESKSTKLSSLRALRLLRIFGSHHSWDGFQILIDALIESFNYVIGFIVIFGIYIYVFAIIGKKLFNIQETVIPYITDTDVGHRGNFENTLWAYTSVFQIICLEKWNELWYKYNRLVGSTTTNFYFIVIIASGRFILFNLFLAALLGLFEQARTNIQLKKMKALFVLRTFRSERMSPLHVIKKPTILESTSPQNQNQLKKLPDMLKAFKRTSTVCVEKAVGLKNNERSFMRRVTKKQQLGSAENIRSAPGNDEDEDDQITRHLQNMEREDVMKSSQEIIKENEEADNQSLVITEARKKENMPKTRKNAIVPLPVATNTKEDMNTVEKTEEKLKTEDNLISGVPSTRKSVRVHVDPLFIESNPSSNRTSMKKRNSFANRPKKSVALKFKEGFTITTPDPIKETITPTNNFGANVFQYLQESSCFLFHKDSRLRIMISSLISTSAWESFIIFLILANSVVLALDNPLSDPNSLLNNLLDNLDYIFTSIFALEMTLKIVSLGFLFNSSDNKKAYIRNFWNQLDCFVVMASILSWAGASNSSLRSLKSLRALRALRSLRMIDKNDSLRIVVNAMFNTIPSIGNVAIVALIINFVVSVNTMNAFKGTFFFCTLPTENLSNYSKVINKDDCYQYGGTWDNQRRHFDDILSSSLSFFLISVNEDWLPLMYSSVDSVGVDQQPIRNHNPPVVLLYYLILVIGYVILINLFVSVVIDNFKQMKEELGGYLLLSKDQKDWVEMQKFMQRKKLKIKIPVPQNKWRLICFRMINHLSFEIFFLVCIFLNVIVMACRYLGMSSQFELFLAIVNHFFLILFNIEMAIKMLGQGFYFFKDSWNKLDFITILSSDILLIFLLSTSEESTSLLVIIRIVRLFRIVKIVKISKTIQVIINTYYNIMPSLGNIGALIFLILYIYSILGMNLFAGIICNPYASGIQPKWIPDFTQFLGSLLTLIQCAMLQKWDHYMFELGEVKDGCSFSQTYDDIQNNGIQGCGTYWSYIYFLSFVLIVPLMIMNLFLAVVVEGYLESLKEQEAVIHPNQMDELIDKWAEYDPVGSGFLTPENMAFLLYELHPPIGLKDDSVQFEYDILSKKNKGYLVSPNKKVILTKSQIFNLMKMYNLRLYNDNKLHFKDLCVKISRNVIMKYRKSHEQSKSGTFKMDPLEINSDYVVKSLNKSWESVYPDLKKQRLEAIKNNRYDLRASDLFAIQSIMTLLKRAKAQKKSKPVANDFDSRVYNEYQQTNIMDKNLSNKVLRTQTVLSTAQNYKKRVSRVSSPYKSRQTMISSPEKNVPFDNTLLKKQTQPSKFSEKTPNQPNSGFSPLMMEFRKTSTADLRNMKSIEHKLDDKRLGKDKRSVMLNPKSMVVNRLGLGEEKIDKTRLKSVTELEEEDKLFWFSYDQDFHSYPMKVKEDIQTLKNFNLGQLAIKQEIKKEHKNIENSEKELEKSKSSATDDEENDSEKEQKTNKKGKEEQKWNNKLVRTPETQTQAPSGIKIMPLKLLKARKKN